VPAAAEPTRPGDGGSRSGRDGASPFGAAGTSQRRGGMFGDFFFLLRAHGVPVTVTEWLALVRALALGLAPCSLTQFYHVARATLVKSEAWFDHFDQAFAAAFDGIETPDEIADEVWRWLAEGLEAPGLTDDERRALAAALELEGVDLEELRRRFEERLAEQSEAHHGGSYWVGTGGTSAFGHSGVHPGGIRVGGESRGRTAVKVAAERRYRALRTDVRVEVRQFELALRRLRQLSSRHEGAADELDLEATVDETADHAGRLSLVWRRSRRNAVKVLLLMDVGGSMDPYVHLCSRLFSAVNNQTHFKDLRHYYFHNCVYDHVYTDPLMSETSAVPTPHLLQELNADYRLILVGDAAMAPSELMSRYGIIWWGHANQEPGIEWLWRLRRHFDHSVWLNTIPASQWDTAYGAMTIRRVGEVFPMFELTVDGLSAAVKKLMVRY
jgi:hypothetical protein